ncbi:MAG: hypothetical protein ACI825_000427 [Planctomycetota bacterium]|jgi:hypothetical protein
MPYQTLWNLTLPYNLNNQTMKKHILSWALILCSFFVIAQEEEKAEHDSILDAAQWGSEFFTFPISFAPAIP